MSTSKGKKAPKTEFKNKLKPNIMQDKEEAIEFYLINKDIWKDFINEPKQNKSNCLLLNMEIKIFEVLAKTFYFMVTIEYEVFDLKKSTLKAGKAVLLNHNKIRSVGLAPVMAV
jgi:hypothetical protein